MAIYYVLYELSYMILIHIFVNILNECIVDSYGVDCFAPVTKSSVIAFMISIVISTILVYKFWGKFFDKLVQFGNLNYKKQ